MKKIVTLLLGMAFFSATAFAGGGRPGWTKVVLKSTVGPHRAVAPEKLQSLGAEKLKDYEAFTVVRVPDAALPTVRERAVGLGLQAEMKSDWDYVYTDGVPVNTRAPEAPGQLTNYPDGKGLYLVQFTVPLTAETNTLIADSGLVSVGYIPYNAVLAYGTGTAVAALQTHPEVQWTSIYHSSYRYQPRAFRLHESSRRYVIQLLNVPEHSETLSKLGAISSTTPTINSYGMVRNVKVTIAPVQIASLLHDPTVIAVEEEGLDVPSGEREAAAASDAYSSTYPFHFNGAPYKPSSLDYRQWLVSKTIVGSSSNVLDTSAYKIAVADTGVDSGHRDLARSGVPGEGDYECLPFQVGGSCVDNNGHGTMVAGIAVGNPSAVNPANDTATHTPNPFYYGMGLAPKAYLIAQPIFLGGTQTDFALAAKNRGAAVQTHSHNEYSIDGGPGAGVYSLLSQEYDVSVRDRNLPVVVSAGNICGGHQNYQNGDCSYRVLSPATAKNVISVGASQSYREITAPPGNACPDASGAFRQPGDFVASSLNNLAYVSRRGTADNRIKPEILAPGTMISSTRASGQNSCFNKTSGDATYGIDTGTSFSAPQVAAAALLINRKQNRSQANLFSPAMLKAALVGTSLSIKGGLDPWADEQGIWTTVPARGQGSPQGYGRLFLQDALSNTSVQTYLDEADVRSHTGLGDFTGSGQTREIRLRVKTPGQKTTIVLAWVDEPAAVPTGFLSLVRDLDMKLQVDEPVCVTYVGSRFNASGNEESDPGTCSQGVSPDYNNNVEMIVAPAGSLPTTFIVKVTTTTWGSYSTPRNTQPFAIYALNACTDGGVPCS